MDACAVEDCTNDADDDGDGDVDCADEDCYSDAACSQSDYAAPFESQRDRGELDAMDLADPPGPAERLDP